MIVTSKRCFLNKFIQKYPAEIVLNANYYIADKQATGSGTMITPEIRRNEFGQLENIGTNYLTNSVPIGSIYHIRYNKVLDPETYKADVAMGAVDGFASSEERYINHLNKDSTILAVYKFLFADRLEGNGLQILIFEDDENLLRFGHITCQYLSKLFGVSIVFIDPSYRPTCNGYPKYDGDPAGIDNIQKIRKYDMVFNFNQAVSQSEYHHSVSNIREHLLCFGWEDLMFLYNTLYPDAPLPPGNYSEDQLREILIYRASFGITKDENAFSNLLIQHDWQSIVDRMSREATDFASDDTGLF